MLVWHLMDHRSRMGLEIPAGFIHVPCLPEPAVNKEKPSMSLDLIVEALEVAASKVASTLT